MRIFYFVLSLVPIFGSPVRDVKEDSCGYKACPEWNSKELNVHLIAHSHDDVGWLKTVDQYYYGGRSNIQIAGVQHILTSVVQALLQNPKRKYIQVESAFFYKWWKEQSDKKKDDVRKLISNGQLQIAGGAWSMNDEAAAHYQSIIDQFTFGLKYLEDTLGACARPKVGWQIDPFGHTREMASIFTQMGYDGLFFARLDWRDKSERLLTKTGEMLWRGSANLGNDSLLFTHVMYNHYSPPAGFYFDILSEDDPLIPDEKSTEFNLKYKVRDFTEYVVKQFKNYSSNHIMIAMGNDFTFQDAHYNFKNLDILIKAYEDEEMLGAQKKRIKLHYSTPACYLKAVNEAASDEGIKYKIKTDDFIPYASDHHSYWSGYYTSRPTQKRFERQGNNLLQVTKHLHVFTSNNETKSLRNFKSAMGVMQHHDAIAGTEKQHVADDYAKIVMKAIDENHKDINKHFMKLLNNTIEKELTFRSCLLANISHCEESQNDTFVVALYNPLSRKVSYPVRLPVNGNVYNVTDPKGKPVPWQVVPSISDFASIPNIAHSKNDLVFIANDLPGLGVHVYYVTKLKDQTDPTPERPNELITIGDKKLNATFTESGHLLTEVCGNNLCFPLVQELMYYVGAQGNNMEFKNRSSGAYIFRPDPSGSGAESFILDTPPKLAVYKGAVVDEVHQIFNEWVRQITRIYKNNDKFIEFDWLVGPIDNEGGVSKEIISRFSAGVVSDNFYTDSNGREMLLRTNDFRATYDYSKEEAIAGNYYPVTSAITLRDNNTNIEIAVLTDRAQGGASLESGTLELMVHRRLMKDDAFGAGEALNETEFGKGLIARGQHYLTFGSIDGTGSAERTRKLQRDIAQRKLLAPWIFVATDPYKDIEQLKKQINFEFMGLKKELSQQVQILTLEPWNKDQVLIRFEHVLELDEGGTTETIDLKDLFTLFKITEVEETDLAGNPKSDSLRWTSDGCLGKLENCESQITVPKELTDLTFQLAPMQIRTFIATITQNN
ncbi:hypothetical protein FQA39_LY05504 [Lamprigera yunnana]|nr:hypothetical protein FQA39_LY05504 [Lamprigera yunnana]